MRMVPALQRRGWRKGAEAKNGSEYTHVSNILCMFSEWRSKQENIVRRSIPGVRV
jgi:hypothetical protein